jgi:hypothetical protein
MAIDKLISWLVNHIEVNNSRSIRRYISRFKDLAELIPVAISIVRKHFPEARIVLDLYVDPEIKDSYPVLYIRLSEYDESFIERLNAAESELLPLLINKKGWIQLSTDFEGINQSTHT